MERISVCAVRFGNIIIYNYDLTSSELNTFLLNNEKYHISKQNDFNNIFINEDNIVIVKEWTKYKVKSLSSDLKIEDFYKIGERYTDDFGILYFKNCVGLSNFKSISIDVESNKISKEEMEKLLDLVNKYIVNLSFDFNQATSSAIIRDKNSKTDLEYHVFLLLHNALSTSNRSVNIFRNFQIIANNPTRAMKASFNYLPLSAVDEISDDSIIELLSGSARLIEYKGKKVAIAERFKANEKCYVPEEILSEETIDTFDTSENRFIKFFISWCLKTITKFQVYFKDMVGYRNQEILLQNEKHIKELSNLLNRTFLKYVGEMRSFPQYSTTLTMRDGYRQLFGLYIVINSLPKAISLNSDIKEIIENKTLDVLYENYCFFALTEIVSQIYNKSLAKMKFKTSKDSFSKTLDKKTSANYFEFSSTDIYPKVRLFYNKNYVQPDSYSKAYDPDISLEIFDKHNNIIAVYIFDSKFKVSFFELNSNDSVEVIKKFKYDDISKMHTYRDAIVKAKAAFILYPGNESVIYSATENITHNIPLNGVGAFPFKIDNDADQLTIMSMLKDVLLFFGQNYN